MQRFIHIQDMVSEWSGKAISWMLLGMVGVVGYEVVARYLFNAPTNWGHETATMLYGSYCMLAGAYTLLHKGHVRMDALYRLLPRRGRAGFDCFTGLLTIGFLVLFLWAAIDFTVVSWVTQEFSPRSPWKPPLYPFKSMLTLAVLLILLQTVVVFIRDLLVLLKRGKLPDVPN